MKARHFFIFFDGAALTLLGLSHGIALEAWLGAVNLLAVCVYAIDKSHAQTGGWRAPESLLHLLALVGGSPGAAWARQAWRHKTLKSGFDSVLLLALILHIAALAHYH